MSINPSRATIIAEWSSAIKILDETRRFGNSGGYPAGNAINYLSLQNSLETILAGDWLDDLEDAVQAIRAALAGILSPSSIANVHRPFLRQFMKSVVGRTNLQSDTEAWQEFYKYCIDNAFYVQSRAFTFGTPAAGGSNLGTQQILRLTTDRYNFPIEAGYVDSKRAICINDANTGTRLGNELFQIKGQASARDELERSGSGLSANLVGQTIDDSILLNAGFRSLSSGTAAAPLGLVAWTSSAGDTSSIYVQDTTNYFRLGPSDTTSTVCSLSLVASTNLSQKLTVSGKTLSPDIPYTMVVIWNRTPGSGAGTMTLRMGSIATTVTVAAQSGWQVTTVPNPLGQGCWYRQFAQNDIQFSIDWLRSSGTINIAEVLLIPGTRFDNTYYWSVPSSATYVQPRVLDSYTWPDIATGSAKVQSFIARGYPGVYLPSRNGSSVSFTEP